MLRTGAQGLQSYVAVRRRLAPGRLGLAWQAVLGFFASIRRAAALPCRFRLRSLPLQTGP